MKFKNLGKNTSKAEVVNISPHGIWLWVNHQEYFLCYDDFPWFKTATIAQIQNIRLLAPEHLFWPDLDVDLELNSLSSLEKYPLIYK